MAFHAMLHPEHDFLGVELNTDLWDVPTGTALLDQLAALMHDQRSASPGTAKTEGV